MTNWTQSTTENIYGSWVNNLPVGNGNYCNQWFGWQWLRIPERENVLELSHKANSRYLNKHTVSKAGADPIPDHTHLQSVWILWELGKVVPASIQKSWSFLLWAFDSLCLIKVLVSPYPETSNDFLTKYPWSRKDAGYCSLRCISVIAASGMCCVSSWNIKWTGERPSAHPCLMGNSHTSSRKDLESPNHDFRTEMAMFVFVCSRVLHGSLCLGRVGYGSIYQNCWAESA